MVVKLVLGNGEIAAFNFLQEMWSWYVDVFYKKLAEGEEDEKLEDVYVTSRNILNRIGVMIENELILESEREKACLMKNRAPLAAEEKEGLTDIQVFMRENGLYTNFVYNEYWTNKFKEIYGYMPELP